MFQVATFMSWSFAVVVSCRLSYRRFVLTTRCCAHSSMSSVCCLFVGAVSVVDSPGSCREGAGSIPTAYMAPPPKRRKRRRSCCEQLTEQVAERTAARGSGGVFLLGTQWEMGGGGGQAL